MAKQIVSLLFFNCIGLTILSAQITAMDSVVNSEMKRMHIAGFEACAIKDGKIIWTGYYGYQNLEKRIPVNEKTLFDVASTTKTITCAALSQLLSQKKLNLDDDINKYLDFKVRNPNYPDIPITIGQILRHRSSICDNADYLSQFWDFNNGDPKIPLNVFLRDYLSANGVHYDVKNNFLPTAPNTQSKYSNIGIAIIGYIVERISGKPFSVYCKENIFVPLSMNRTGWFLSEIDSQNVAMPYHYNDSSHTYQPLGHGGFPDYPSGALKTNIDELSHFLIAWTQKGKWANRQVFDSLTIQQLTPTEINLGFYVWFLCATNKSAILYCHTGSGNGISTFISYNPINKKGLIFLTNGDIDNKDDWQRMINDLYSNIF